MKGKHMSYEEERVTARDEAYEDVPRQRAIELPSSGDLTNEEKQWGMFCHLAALAGLVVPGGNLIGPLVCWMVKKDTSRFVDYHGKESVNFQINMLIYLVICFALTFVLIGFILLPIVGIYAIVMPIIAGLKANEGQKYEYPATWRLLT
jgi:uncharacterized Tic20 family protein